MASTRSAKETTERTETGVLPCPPEFPKPKWKIWGELETVRLVDAILLSLDINPIEPRNLTPRRFEYDLPSLATDRYVIASNFLSPLGPLHPRHPDWATMRQNPIQGAWYSSVNLRDCYNFAVFKEWALPDEFHLTQKNAKSRFIAGPVIQPTPIKRKTILHAEIEIARNSVSSEKGAANEWNPNLIWSELINMAEKAYGCLLGFADGEIKYTKHDGQIGFLNFDSLSKRLKRQALPKA